MTASRRNVFLGAALLVQIALVAIVHLAQSKPTVARLEPILELEADDITKLEIFGRLDGTADKTAADIVLERPGASWTVTSHFGYAADSTKVDAFLTKVVGMSAREPVATKAARHRQLRVAADKYERRLIVHRGTGEPIELYIGASAGRQQTAVRIKGQEKTFGASGITSYAAATTVTSWIDTSYLKLTGPMSTLEVTNAQGRWKLRKIDGAWKRHEGKVDVPIPEGKELNAAGVDGAANALLNLPVSEPADPALASFEPRATIVFAGADGASHTLKVGQEKEEQALVVVDDKVPVWVSKGVVSSLIDFSDDTVYKDPPKPGDEPPPPPPGAFPPGMMPPGGALPPGIQ